MKKLNQRELHENITVKELKELFIEQIRALPDVIFMDELKFDKYFKGKTITDIKESKENLNLILSRIYVDKLFNDSKNNIEKEKKVRKKSPIK